jgi:hypothetical protein
MMVPDYRCKPQCNTLSFPYSSCAHISISIATGFVVKLLLPAHPFLRRNKTAESNRMIQRFRFRQAIFRLSLNDKFINEFVLVVRRPAKVLGQNLTDAFNGFAEPVAAS